MSGWHRVRAFATSLAASLTCIVSVRASADAQVSGMALLRERVRLPPDAVFEASLEDVTHGDAPAPVLGRTRIDGPGNPPIRFAIEYDESRIDPRHLYRVRARILVGSRQRFVADHSDLVLTWGHGRRVALLLQRSNVAFAPERGETSGGEVERGEVSRGEVPRREVPRREVPRREVPRGDVSSGSGSAIFTGDLPCADCAAIRHQLELFPNQSYFLRRSYLGKGRDAFVDEIGRWTLSRDRSTLTLIGGGDTPLRIAIGKPDTLHVLGGSGKRIASSRPNTLTLSNRAPPLEPRLRMRGMYRYLADAGRFTECVTRQSWPVAQERDNAALESAYSRERRTYGDEVLVELLGRVAMRPRIDGSGRERTLVVEQFEDVKAGERCGAGASNAPLENTYWRLTRLGDRAVTVDAGQRAPFLTLSAETGRMSGWVGCSGVTGRYSVIEQSLTFSSLSSMRTACAAGMDLERRYLTALRTVSRAKVTRQRLELFDARGRSLARFEAGRGND